MKKDGRVVVAKVAEFMGCVLEPYTVDSITSQATFDKMQRADTLTIKFHWPGEAPHFRKGIVGDWKTTFQKSSEPEWMMSMTREWLGLDWTFGSSNHQTFFL